MKPDEIHKILWMAVAAAALFVVSACSPVRTGRASGLALEGTSPEAHAAEAEQAGVAPEQEPEASEAGSAGGPPASAPQGMVAFQGSVFVASTELISNLWQRAGWRIGEQPVDTDAQELPPDCTLYPHQGVKDQWVGRCTGYILVPQEGAAHIAVVVINPDGSTSMVQVAPPGGNAPP